jgi:hypothetical protein
MCRFWFIVCLWWLLSLQSKAFLDLLNFLLNLLYAALQSGVWSIQHSFMSPLPVGSLLSTLPTNITSWPLLLSSHSESLKYQK